MNQAMLMRFLSARSVGTARRSAGVVLLVLMPLAAIAVSGAGWLGAAMANAGDLPADTSARDVFMVVADLLCGPGLFGLVIATLLAALMSTADTLINASSAVLVNDLYRPYLRPGRDDAHYLRAARWTSLLAAAIGVSLVPLFSRFDSIYAAHGAFTAAITPPLTTAIVLAFTWPGLTPAGALAMLVGGTAAMFASISLPDLVAPFSHGVPDTGGFKFIRACYGVAVSAAIGVGVSLFTRPRAAAGIAGLTIWTCRHRASTSAAAKRRSRRVRTVVTTPHAGGEDPLGGAGGAGGAAGAGDGELAVALPAAVRERLAVDAGDVVFIDDARWWLGGLRSARATVAHARVEATAGAIELPPTVLDRNHWRPGQAVVLQRVD